MRLIVRSFLLILFFVYHISPTKAQTYTFGKVSADEFSTENVLVDTSDGALVLFDSTAVSLITIEGLFFQKEIRYRRVLILKDDALHEATVVFPKTEDRFGITRDLKHTFQGYTYHLQNGQVSVAATLDTSDIYSDKFSSKVVFPKVKKGCIFEIRSEIEEPLFLNFFTWKIQGDYPVYKSALNITITEHFDVSITTFGGEAIKPISSNEIEIRNKKGGEYYLNRFIDNGTFKGQQLYYSCTNVPAFHGGKYLHNPDEHTKSIQFKINQYNLSSMDYDFKGINYDNVKKFEKSWSEFAPKILKNDNLLNSTSRIERLRAYVIPKFPAGTDDKEKIDSIITFVKQKVEWNKKHDYLPKQSINETLEKGNGSSADINALLLALLKALDFKVYPVLISPRGSGTLITKYVETNQLNRLVVAIQLGENIILRDASNRYLNNALLPLSDYNGNAALIREDSVEFINLSADYLKMNEKFQHKILVKKDKSCEVTCTINPTLFRSAELRKSLFEDKSFEGIKLWLLARSFKTPDSISVENQNNLDESLKINLFYKFKPDQEANKLMIPALIWGKTFTNPFARKSKELPAEIDFCLNQLVVNEIVFEDQLPEIKLPEKLAANFNEQGIIFQFEVGVFENTINVMSRLKTNKTFFSAKESAGIEEYFDSIVKKQHENITVVY